jgi:hypothetical protein
MSIVFSSQFNDEVTISEQASLCRCVFESNDVETKFFESILKYFFEFDEFNKEQRVTFFMMLIILHKVQSLI